MKSIGNRCFIMIIWGLSLIHNCWAQDHSVQPARIFGSHMVLQCDAPIRIWGRAEEGDPVKITLDRETVKTKTNDSGDWSVIFSPRKASFQPITLQINDIRFDDILIGEVWICSGQSNMEFPLSRTKNSTNLLQKANVDGLRFCSHGGLSLVAKNGFLQKELDRCNVQEFFRAQWVSSQSDSAAGTSAVAWVFGRGLFGGLDVPVGIIQVAVGGSAMNNWIPPEAARTNLLTASLYEKDWLSNKDVYINHRNRARDAFQNVLKPGEAYIIGKTPYRWMCEPGFLFEAGIAPLKGLAFRGVVWYQGESDTWSDSIIEKAPGLFSLLVNSWRQYFSEGDFPFIYVQLPGHNARLWPPFREMQRDAEQTLPNTAMVVTIDLGEPKNVHPRDKQPVGERVLRMALKQAYGQTNLLGFPEIDKIKKEEGQLIIKCCEVGKGFLPVEGKIPGFEVADESGVFRAAVAVLSSFDTLVVKSPVTDPVEIRYGWQPYPSPSLKLFNSDKLPLGPFVMPVAE